ncbi:hypothetical protein pdam_00006085 [Pocillopora damicornis]|uniref:Uncharacterized protein n=1 Tax=Pocillopora damicornis TaxID=46731 RepID=A0A3M6TT12_POCDA|nr:hypothetical protein pdam_00006085 [Pocillopora damicornis]
MSKEGATMTVERAESLVMIVTSNFECNTMPAFRSGIKFHTDPRVSEQEQIIRLQQSKQKSPGRIFGYWLCFLLACGTNTKRTNTRQKWTQEDYIEVTFCYHKAKAHPSEGVTKDIYRIWKESNPNDRPNLTDNTNI